ncbi:LysM peptidoglycan-binding domain-containing protein [Desulfolutivibrio sp.]|uniref:LysM peptidoglycan-binding domain-containing protein n=1 Tax=Desulfolutivibrio sp. TaxID=2773296 RepID=UPI002F961A04
MNTTRFGGLAAICAMLLCLGLAGAALAADPEKKPDGFRGIAWGTEAASLKDMTLVETDGEFTDYDRKGDKKDLGGMPVAMVTYGFYKGQFYHAAIAYEGATGFDAVQEHLAAKYGPPDAVAERSDDAGRAYVLAAWNWPGYAYIGHRRYKDGSAGRVFYFYSPLVEASKAAAASSVATAAMDPQAPGAGKASATQAKPRPGSDEKPGKPGPVGRPSSAASLDRPAPSASAVQDEAAPSPAVQVGARPAPTIPAAPGQGRTHVVEKGDMLSALAKRYGVPRKDILAANPGINPTNLKLGQTVIIPAGGKAQAGSEPQAAAPETHAAAAPEAKPAPETASASETAPAPVSGEEASPVPKAQSEAVKAPAPEKKAAPGAHIIVQGDMISGLAKRYGVTEKAILKANPGLKASNLKLGAVVRLPHGATMGAAEQQGAPDVAATAPEPKPEPGTEPKPEPKVAAKPETKPEPEAKVVAAPPAKPEARSESTPQPAPEAAPRVAGPEPGTAPKAEARQAASEDGQKAQATRPREHVLEFDDTVSGLAKRYGVTEKAIFKANPGLDSRKLKPGRKIKIP